MNLKPETSMTSEEWYDQAMQPDFPDEIALQLNRAPMDNDPLTTFSLEGVNEIAEQFRMFLMARIVGQQEKKGVMPKRLRATVKLDWAPPPPITDPEVGPFFEIAEDTGIEPLDHTRRHEWRHV